MIRDFAQHRARGYLVAALVGGLALAAGPAAAEETAGPKTFVIDPVHSAIQFKVRHNMIAKVPGHFSAFEGVVTYEAGKPTSLQPEVTIQTASITTGNERRDTHLKSDDFFAAETHPTITFKSTKAEAAGESKVRLMGDLTMRGVTKPVVLDVTILGVAPGMGGTTLFALEATGTVNRKDFGINWDRTLDTGGVVVSDEVQMIVQVEAKYAPPKAEGGS